MKASLGKAHGWGPDSELPVLAFSELETVCSQLLEWARPLLADVAFDKSRDVVQAFLAPGGAGQVLRAELDRLYPLDQSILEWMPYWEQWYLSHRAALPVNSNPFYLLAPRAENLGIDDSELVARAVVATLDFYRKCEEGILERDAWKGIPLSMSQYRKIVGITRVPGRERDENRRSDADWIAVICRGRLFRQRVLNSEGRPLPGEGLARSFGSILDRCYQGEPAPFPLAALTCIPRTRWAELREELYAGSSQVAWAIDVMERSLFVVCLDPPAAAGDEELSRALLHGVPGNRWFDKSLQLVALGKGRLGINFEHSARDGTPMGRFVRFLCDGIQEGSLASGEVPEAEEVTPSANPSLRIAVEEAREFADRLFSGTHLNLLNFGHFGKERIKQLGVSPDGFLQTALFLAQDRAWGRCRSVFESVMLRPFRGGRTEGMRPFNGWTRKFIDAMTENGVAVGERSGFLRQALQAHGDRISLCMRGDGVDGQLGLLLAIAEGRVGNRLLDSVPALFHCPAWEILQDIGVTTSTTSGEDIEAAGYGPALTDGLAVRYLQRPDHISLSITGLDPGEAGRMAFMDHLPGALSDMEELLG